MTDLGRGQNPFFNSAALFALGLAVQLSGYTNPYVAGVLFVGSGLSLLFGYVPPFKNVRIKIWLERPLKAPPTPMVQANSTQMVPEPLMKGELTLGSPRTGATPEAPPRPAAAREPPLAEPSETLETSVRVTEGSNFYIGVKNNLPAGRVRAQIELAAEASALAPGLALVYKPTWENAISDQRPFQKGERHFIPVAERHQNGLVLLAVQFHRNAGGDIVAPYLTAITEGSQERMRITLRLYYRSGRSQDERTYERDFSVGWYGIDEVNEP